MYIDDCVLRKCSLKGLLKNFIQPNDTRKLCVVLLLLTGDLQAHAEIGQTSAGGFKGYQHCHAKGEYIPVYKHYYYGNFEKLFCFTPEKAWKKVDSAATAAE